MITRLEIKGFKSLVDISIELGAINVFIGANGSGKSNLLEALGIIAAVASGRAEAEAFHYRGVRVGEPSSYFSAFRNRVQERLEIKAADAHVTYSVGLTQSKYRPTGWAIDEESVWLDGVETVQRAIVDGHQDSNGNPNLIPLTELQNFTESMSIGSVVAGLGLLRQDAVLKMSPSEKQLKENSWAQQFKEFDIFFLRLVQYAIYNPSTTQLRGLFDDIHRDPVGLGGSGIDMAIDEMLDVEGGMFGPFDLDEVYNLIEWIDQFVVVPSSKRRKKYSNQLRLADRFLEEGRQFISAVEASEGSLYVLLILVLAGHERSPRTFSIDNFDQSLHPRLARSLTKLVADQILKDGSRQMLATTHNPLVLDGLDLLDDRVRLFAVDRDSTGATQVNRILVTKELMAQADNGMSLSRLWVQGRLGGVPRNL